MKKYAADNEETFVLAELIKFANSNRDFKRTFIDDCADFLYERGFLTENQINMLKRIYQENNVYEYLMNYEQDYLAASIKDSERIKLL